MVSFVESTPTGRAAAAHHGARGHSGHGLDRSRGLQRPGRIPMPPCTCTPGPAGERLAHAWPLLPGRPPNRRAYRHRQLHMQPADPACWLWLGCWVSCKRCRVTVCCGLRNRTWPRSGSRRRQQQTPCSGAPALGLETPLAGQPCQQASAWRQRPCSSRSRAVSYRLSH